MASCSTTRWTCERASSPSSRSYRASTPSADRLQPDAEEVEEALAQLLRQAALAPAHRVHLFAQLEVVAELLLQAPGDLRIQHLQRQLPIAQQAAGVEVVTAHRPPSAVDADGLRVQHSRHPLEELHSR